MAVDVQVRVLNFVVVGNIRSGTSVVQTAICHRGEAYCHADLLNDNPDVCRKQHEAYFGKCPDFNERDPEWFFKGVTNPWQYISRSVFDQPRRDEKAIGVRLLYPTIAQLELFSMFHEKYLEGDFCVIHVERNPVACFISYKQAQRSGLWSQDFGDEPKRSPMPMSLDLDELIKFCRDHISLSRKIQNACRDALLIHYRDLHFHFQPVMRRVWDFLELDEDNDAPARAGFQRLRNEYVRDRILNIDFLRKTAPSDVRELLDAEDLF